MTQEEYLYVVGCYYGDLRFHLHSLDIDLALTLDDIYPGIDEAVGWLCLGYEAENVLNSGRLW